jgi:hypothetical protein
MTEYSLSKHDDQYVSNYKQQSVATCKLLPSTILHPSSFAKCCFQETQPLLLVKGSCTSDSGIAPGKSKGTTLMNRQEEIVHVL